MTNPFVLVQDDYVRRIDPVGQYIDQASKFLAMRSKKPLASCEAFVRKVLKGGVIPGIVDPAITYLERGENGDRVRVEGTLLGYIQESLQNKELIAPTLTTYLNPADKESLLVNYVEDNVAARGKAKKAMFAAEAAGDTIVASFKNVEQTNKKLSNNAVSGAHVSASTPLSNRTAHSTLTSTCRSTSGYGNANNEKFLSGNRHLWSPQIVINNIVSVTTHFDEVGFAKVVEKYNLSPISVDEAVSCIKFSTDLYWRNPREFVPIIKLLEDLTPLQRQAYVYIGDMAHLMTHNSDMVSTFIGKLSAKIVVTPENKPENALAICKKAEEDNMNLAHQICSTEMKDRGKAYVKMLVGYNPDSKENQEHLPSSPELDTLALTVQNIHNVLAEYTDLIQALWVTDNVPASMAYFPESIRRAALTSDTDSTIFTVQDWVEWYHGSIGFDEECVAVAATMIFLASQTITHVLAKMSVNFGIEKKRLNQIAMKNEFYFPVFVPTQVAKHYYANIGAQEGNVFGKLKKEIKGVHLKSSNAPKRITKLATKLMDDILETTMSGKKLSLVQVLTEIADTERAIGAGIRAAELDYFRLAQIKTPDSYTNSERSSPYGYHLLWNEVFAQKYGSIANPPYSCIKISTTLTNPSTTKKWVESIKDKALSERFAAWFAANGKTTLPTMYLSLEIVNSKGIPEELVDIIDVRTMVSDLSRIFYIILETLGFYVLNDKLTRLCSDEY